MIYSALFHDAYDHKYVKNESKRESLISEISDFLKNIGIDENGIEIIHAIISDISFSEELKKRTQENNLDCPITTFDDQIIQDMRNIVSDADKIEAIGDVAIKRMIQYRKHLGTNLKPYSREWYQDHIYNIRKHAGEKLFILLSKNYIRTLEGRQIASEKEEELRENIMSDQYLRDLINIYS